MQGPRWRSRVAPGKGGSPSTTLRVNKPLQSKSGVRYASVREYPGIMLNGRELVAFRKSLLGWFRQFQRDLPWRRTKDPYRVWLSEIMLQQTRVAAALPYYERFLQAFPAVHALAAPPQEELLPCSADLAVYSQ